jgi:probable rRNA maturation factor
LIRLSIKSYQFNLSTFAPLFAMITFFADDIGISSQLENQLQGIVTDIVQEYNKKLCSLNVVFVSDDELLEVNRKFLQHDDYTDIITFNYSDIPEIIEGELYISHERVAENAGKYGATFEHELARVVIHGTLHLAGFEDYNETLKKQMQLLEYQYVERIRFT